MGKELDKKEVVTFEELLLSNTLQQEAMFNILERKGLMTKAELMEEMVRLNKDRLKSG